MSCPLCINLLPFLSSEALLLLISTKSSNQGNLIPRGSMWSCIGNRDPWPGPTTFGFEWLCKHNRLRPEPIRFVRLDSGYTQSDRKSVNCGLPVLDLARGRDPCLLTKRIGASGNEIASGKLQFSKQVQSNSFIHVLTVNQICQT